MIRRRHFSRRPFGDVCGRLDRSNRPASPSLEVAVAPLANGPELPAELRPEDIFADGYVFDDRRTGGVNYGQLDATAQFRGLEQFWLLGSQPHFSIVEVIAVRGERCAAYIEKVAYVEADMFMETIMVMKSDPALERSQTVVFDVDDRDAAIAELDRMHAEINNSPRHSRSADSPFPTGPIPRINPTYLRTGPPHP